jgi:hypothetical protein
MYDNKYIVSLLYCFLEHTILEKPTDFMVVVEQCSANLLVLLTL